MPGDAEIPAYIGFIRRRQGDIRASIDNLERAVRLSPRDGELFFNLGNSYWLARDYERAAQTLRRAGQF